MRSLLSFKHIYNSPKAKNFFAFGLILPLVIIYTTEYSFGQITYFNKRLDFNNNYDESRSILALDSGYIMANITVDSIYNYYFHIILTKLNKEGEEIIHKEYGFEGSDIFFGNPGSLLQTDTAHFFTSGTKRFFTSDWVHDQGILICYNSVFDTLWTKCYGEETAPYDTAFMIYQLKRSQNNSFIFTGLRYQNGNVNHASRIWLLKTDSLGNKLWEKFYGEGEEYFQGHSVVQTNDGGFVIGAAKFEIHATGGYVDPLIIKTDSLGNEEWRINPGNPHVDDNKVMVALAQDGNIIAGTNYGTEQHVDNRDAVVKIMKITPDGTVLWDNNYLEPQWDNFLLNITVLSNSNIIANGSYTSYYSGEEYPFIMGWILCIDSSGNQLWYKEYALLTGHMSFNDLYDVRETPDGGLIGVGMVNPTVPDTGTNDIWLMKMDSTGCLFAGCDTTVVVEETAVSQKYFKLYPNPANEYIALEYDLGYNTENPVVEIVTLSGVHTETFRLRGIRGIKIVDLRDRQTGTYIIRLTANGKTLQNEKFVKF
ncbi:MAG: hypothetical protein DRI87_07715 [Bacteroidetes bacterium]|nr:MAG: hypothetical protein DRI87_07715 [Bacteroidota bacterium]